MIKPYKLTPIELALSPKEERFEDNHNEFVDNETNPNDEKLLLIQSTLRRVNMLKPYHERPLKVNVINHRKKTLQNSETLVQQSAQPIEKVDLSLSKVSETLQTYYLNCIMSNEKDS